MLHDASCSKVFEENWDEKMKNMKIDLSSNYIIIGPKWAAMNVEPNPFIAEWYNVTVVQSTHYPSGK